MQLKKNDALRGGRELLEQLVIFPPSYLIDLAWEKLSQKIANGDHVTMECRKCYLAVKHPNCNL